jgi:hypothetical protein
LTKVAVDKATGIPDRSVYGDPFSLPERQFVDFVLQEHHAHKAGPHFDLRLGTPELGLFSWAVRKGLPEPGEKHLAILQPLHEYSYKDFEGEISEGYGAGTVKLKQQGKVLIDRVSDKSIVFTVGWGRYLRRYALVKTSDPEKWLLINITPTEPFPWSKEKFKSVPAEKVSDILRDLQPEASVQAKIDGAAALVKLLDDSIEIASYRIAKDTGWPIIHTERILGHVPKLKIPKELVGTILRGEIYMVDEQGRAIPPQELGGILNASLEKSLDIIAKKKLKPRVAIFDLPLLGGKPVSLPMSERRKKLQEILDLLNLEALHLMPEVKDPQEALKLWEEIVSGKHPLTNEGIVIHTRDKPLKVKIRPEADVYIREIFRGDGKYKDSAGGFYYSLTPDGPIVGKVGTGLSDELRKDMFENPKEYIGRVARIAHQGQFASGSYRAPSLIALHEDYPTKDQRTNV